MTFFAEALQSLAVALRAVCHDATAFDDFNTTVDGFWRSFGAILFLAPLAYPVFLSGHAYDVSLAAEGRATPELDLVMDYIYLAVSFVAWAIVAAVLARLFGLSATYLRYMIAYNWISVPALAFSLLPHLLLMAGWIDVQTATIPFLAVFVALAYLSWYVARQGLQCSRGIAAAFVAADYAVTLGLGQLLRG